MVTPNIEKLPAYVDYYLRRVIGIAVDLADSPQPCSIKAEKPQIELPLTPETLGQFLGPDFVAEAPVELLFSIVVGLAYHEAAHLVSGEPHVTPHLLDNIINDSNDLTFVPRTWKGSMPFTISLINTTYRQGMDLKDIPITSRDEKLKALIHLSVSYLRKLRIRENNKDSRFLPQNHALEPYFELIKPIMRGARQAKLEQRPVLVQQLYDVLKVFWDTDISPANMTFDEALKGEQPGITIILSAEDAQALQKILKSSGALQKIAGELTRTAISVCILEATEEKKNDQKALKRILELGDLGLKISIEEPDPAAEPVPVDPQMVRKLTQVLKPLLFERSLARRKPSVTGTRFAPSHFHEIRTRPEQPRIRKEVRRIGRASVETTVILCFDRSGSMAGDKEGVCKEVAGTFHRALAAIPQVDVTILGFDDEVTVITGKGKNCGDGVLKMISTGLSARGGTDFPLALYHALRTAEKYRAHKKIIIMLTDGDINGQIEIADLLRYAKTMHTDIVTIGVSGSDENTLKQQLGVDRVISIMDIHTLPEELRKLALRIV